MADTEIVDNPETEPTAEVAAEKPKLTLDVKIAKPSACERHITVTISREDVDRYIGEQFAEIAPKAVIPGFRAGRAPRKLVEKAFKESVSEQVKGKLLMDSLTQMSVDHEFSAISEPEFDIQAVSIPDQGPLVFEFDIEVRPEFELPQWKGLRLERPMHEYSDADISEQLDYMRARFARLEDQAGPVEAGNDQIVKLHAVFKDGETVVSEAPDLQVEVRPVLSFIDARLKDFDQLVIGKSVGDVVTAPIKVSYDAENEALRGKELQAELRIEEIKRRKLPDIDDGFLDRLGGFETEAALRTAVKGELQRRLVYYQQRRLREQITALLTVAADWDLPRGLLKRQAHRELERAVMELKSSGFDDKYINNYVNELRQNAAQHTARALKEHFILERIAEEEKIDAAPEDYDREIELIAEQGDESARRVRARMEKRGQIDTLRNQIVERKVLELITSHASFVDVPHDPPKTDDVSSVSHAIAGADASSIPEAKHAGSGEEQVPGTHASKP